MMLLSSLFFLFLLTFSVTHANALISANCPSPILISIECRDNPSLEFQLLGHLGKYVTSRVDIDSSSNRVICSYSALEWVSKYKLINEHVRSISTLNELSSIAQVVLSKGLKATYLNDPVHPFSVVTFIPDDGRLYPERMFLFSGIESTFGEDNFSVGTTQHNEVSTVVVGDTYLKSKNTATDIFVTGSSCRVKVKN